MDVSSNEAHARNITSNLPEVLATAKKVPLIHTDAVEVSRLSTPVCVLQFAPLESCVFSPSTLVMPSTAESKTMSFTTPHTTIS